MRLIFPYFVTQQASLPQPAPVARLHRRNIHNEMVADGMRGESSRQRRKRHGPPEEAARETFAAEAAD
jgi:hypothetical protein